MEDKEAIIKLLIECGTISAFARRRGVTRQAAFSYLKTRGINSKDVLAPLKEQYPREDLAGKILNGHEIVSYAGFDKSGHIRLWNVRCSGCKGLRKLSVNTINNQTSGLCRKCAGLNVTKTAIEKQKEFQALRDSGMTLDEIAEQKGCRKANVWSILHAYKRERKMREKA